MEKNSNTLLFYQINQPKDEPYFTIVNDDELIYCVQGRDNFFYSAVVFIFLMKEKMGNITRKLRLDE